MTASRIPQDPQDEQDETTSVPDQIKALVSSLVDAMIAAEEAKPNRRRAQDTTLIPHDAHTRIPHDAHTRKAPGDTFATALPTHPAYAGKNLVQRIGEMRQRGNIELPPITPNELLLLADIAISYVAMCCEPNLDDAWKDMVRSFARHVEDCTEHDHDVARSSLADLIVGSEAFKDVGVGQYDASKPHPFADPDSDIGKHWAKGVALGKANIYPSSNPSPASDTPTAEGK